MAKEQPRFLAVLPWLQLAEEIEVGPFTFWRWPKDKRKHIPLSESETVRKSLQANFRYLDKKTHWTLGKLKSLCMVSHKEKGAIFTRGKFEEILEDMKTAIDILCLCSLYQTDIQRDPESRSIGWTRYYTSYDDFSSYVIPVDAGGAAKMIKRRYGYAQSFEFPPIPHVKPRGCTDQDIKINDSLLPSCEKLLVGPKDNFRRRIFRAIAQFNSAFSDFLLHHPLVESTTVYYYRDIVNIATAFEILLDIRKSKKTEELSKRMEELFPQNQQIPEPTTGKAWKVYWMRQFYKLRNDIVHGKEISYADLDWNQNPYAGRHVEIAIYVFRLILMKLLVSKGFHEETDLDTYQADSLDKFLSTEMESFPSKHDLDFVLWQVKKKFGSD